MPLDLAAVELVERLLGRRFVEREEAARVLGVGACDAPHLVPVAQAEPCDGVGDEGVAESAFVDACAVGQGQHLVVVGEDLLPEQRFVGACGGRIDRQLQRVDRPVELGDVLGRALVREVGVRAFETETLHGDDAVLLLEDVMAQRAFAVPLVVARLLVGLAVEERDEQVFLVVRQADVARVGHRGGHVAVDVAVVVDQHVAQQVGLGVLFADADAHVLDAVEEEPVLEFDDLFLLADVVEDAEHLLVGIGNQIVHHEETADGDDAHHDDERFEYFRQRHARRLHRQQFVVFAQVAQRHDRRQ